MKNYIGKPFANYYPLTVILAIILAAAMALSLRLGDGGMAYFMGLFFIVFSMFKLLDPKGFAAGFSMYDIVAKKYPPYAKIYPFLELALGFLYLSGIYPVLTNIATIVIMSISGYSVVKALRSGLDVRCACLGTLINVPLSTVSAIENIGMGLMALASLLSML